MNINNVSRSPPGNDGDYPVMNKATRYGYFITMTTQVRKDSIMNNETKRILPIQVKVTPEIKEKIAKRATSADLTVSEYIRVSALSDKKIIFLNESGSIAKSLAEININLDRALRDRDITTEVEKELLEKFSAIYDIFYDILETLSEHNKLNTILEG